MNLKIQKFIFWSLLALVLGVPLLMHMVGIDKQHPSDKMERRQIDPKQEVCSLMEVTASWDRSNIGTVLGNFLVDNRSSYNVKDVKITCSFYAPSGTIVTVSAPTLYKIIPASSSESAVLDIGVIHPQAATAYCRATDLIIIGQPEKQAP